MEFVISGSTPQRGHRLRIPARRSPRQRLLGSEVGRTYLARLTRNVLPAWFLLLPPREWTIRPPLSRQHVSTWYASCWAVLLASAGLFFIFRSLLLQRCALTSSAFLPVRFLFPRSLVLPHLPHPPPSWTRLVFFALEALSGPIAGQAPGIDLT
jgi:hypothetical protein